MKKTSTASLSKTPSGAEQSEVIITSDRKKGVAHTDYVVITKKDKNSGKVIYTNRVYLLDA